MYFAGVDLGSLTAKAVIIKNGDIVCHRVIQSGYNSVENANRVMNACLEETTLALEDMEYIISTGYGRVNVPFAHKQVTEITCTRQGRGITSSPRLEPS